MATLLGRWANYAQHTHSEHVDPWRTDPCHIERRAPRLAADSGSCASQPS